jgi:hypothetical protein
VAKERSIAAGSLVMKGAVDAPRPAMIGAYAALA